MFGVSGLSCCFFHFSILLLSLDMFQEYGVDGFEDFILVVERFRDFFNGFLDHFNFAIKVSLGLWDFHLDVVSGANVDEYIFQVADGGIYIDGLADWCYDGHVFIFGFELFQCFSGPIEPIQNNVELLYPHGEFVHLFLGLVSELEKFNGSKGVELNSFHPVVWCGRRGA